MAIAFYKGIDTYLIYAEDSAFGTPGTPAGSAYVDKVTIFTATVTNNFFRSQGIGEGRNATAAVPMLVDVVGTMDWELTDPAFLKYCFIGTVAGAGTAADPYEIQEANEIGYTAGQVKTLTLEQGSNGGANDDVSQFDGVAIKNFTVTADKGAVVTCTADWIGRNVTTSSTLETYSRPTNRPFTFIDGSLYVSTDAAFSLQNFNMTTANNIFTHHGHGSRFIQQPVAGIRRYDFTFTIKLAYNDAATTLSGLEARGIVLSGATTGTTILNAAEFPATSISYRLIEGASSGDRVVRFELESCYFESYSYSVGLEDGAIDLTISGFGLAGLTDGAVKVPCRFWTI